MSSSETEERRGGGTLQYEPPGRPVINVMLHSLSSLLIATKPSEPVFPHARELPSLQGHEKGAHGYEVRTGGRGDLLGRRRDPSREGCAVDLVPERDQTMLAIASQRCWQNLQSTTIQVVTRYYISRMTATEVMLQYYPSIFSSPLQVMP